MFSLLDYTGIYHFHSGSGFVPSADWAWGFQHQSVHDGPDASQVIPDEVLHLQDAGVVRDSSP